MSKTMQAFGSVFVLALVGAISLCASTYLKADEGSNPLVVPVPLPVVSVAPLQVTAPQPLPISAPAPIPVTGTVAVTMAPVHWEYKVLDPSGMMGGRV